MMVLCLFASMRFFLVKDLLAAGENVPKTRLALRSEVSITLDPGRFLRIFNFFPAWRWATSTRPKPTLLAPESCSSSAAVTLWMLASFTKPAHTTSRWCPLAAAARSSFLVVVFGGLGGVSFLHLRDLVSGDGNLTRILITGARALLGGPRSMLAKSEVATQSGASS